MAKWLTLGCQRAAVAQVLRKPMTSNEIWQAAKTLAPRIQLRDVWLLLRQMRSRRLVHCLNPTAITGKLFFYTEEGCQVALAAFDITFPQPPAEMDWDAYSWVVRGRVRKLVLLELGQAPFLAPIGLTPSQIRRNFRGRHSIGKNLILRALQELGQHDLVASQPAGRRTRQRVFTLTQAGQCIDQAIRA